MNILIINLIIYISNNYIWLMKDINMWHKYILFALLVLFISIVYKLITPSEKKIIEMTNNNWPRRNKII